MMDDDGDDDDDGGEVRNVVNMRHLMMSLMRLLVKCVLVHGKDGFVLDHNKHIALKKVKKIEN
jgi:hypothetical protein